MLTRAGELWQCKDELFIRWALLGVPASRVSNCQNSRALYSDILWSEVMMVEVHLYTVKPTQRPSKWVKYIVSIAICIRSQHFDFWRRKFDLIYFLTLSTKIDNSSLPPPSPYPPPTSPRLPTPLHRPTRLPLMSFNHIRFSACCLSHSLLRTVDFAAMCNSQIWKSVLRSLGACTRYRGVVCVWSVRCKLFPNNYRFSLSLTDNWQFTVRESDE